MPTEPTPHAPPDGSTRWQVIGVFGSAPWSVGGWLNATGTPSGTDLNDLANGVYTSFEDTLLEQLNHLVVADKAVVTYHAGGLETQGVHLGSEVGGMTDNPLPSNVAIVISYPIAEHYRGGKPRNYLPGAMETSIFGTSTWADSFVSALSGAAADFLSEMNALTAGGITAVEMGTIHFFRAYAALNPPEFSAYLGAFCQKRVCTQRRRLGREL